MQRAKTTLICGFLGAGKTTFIRSQLQECREKTVVLVNEFGSLGMDGLAIQELDGLQVVEMAGGCICCSQKLALTDRVAEIVHRFQPERLFIEPSGVAEATELITILTEGKARKLLRLDGVITLVDAETFLDYSEPDCFGTFFCDQIGNADVVVINKMDLVAEDELQAVTERLQTINPTALITPASYGKLAADLPQGRVRSLSSSGRGQLDWEYVCLQPEGHFSEARVHELATHLARGSFGKIFRAKGLVRAESGKYLHLQLVGHRWQIDLRHSSIQPRLTCIGFNLDRRGLLDFLASDRPSSITLTSTTCHEPPAATSSRGK